MNERNVRALAAAFGGAFFRVCGGALDPQELLDVAREVIRERGVLVPRSLTEAEANWPRACGTPQQVREILEQIARGDR